MSVDDNGNWKHCCPDSISSSFCKLQVILTVAMHMEGRCNSNNPECPRLKHCQQQVELKWMPCNVHGQCMCQLQACTEQRWPMSLCNAVMCIERGWGEEADLPDSRLLLAEVPCCKCTYKARQYFSYVHDAASQAQRKQTIAGQYTGDAGEAS